MLKPGLRRGSSPCPAILGAPFCGSVTETRRVRGEFYRRAGAAVSELVAWSNAAVSCGGGGDGCGDGGGCGPSLPLGAPRGNPSNPNPNPNHPSPSGTIPTLVMEKSQGGRAWAGVGQRGFTWVGEYSPPPHAVGRDHAQPTRPRGQL